MWWWKGQLASARKFLGALGLLTTSGNLLSEAHNPPEHTDKKGTNGDLLDCNLS